MKKVIIYPGRFQPMLSHHAEVYDRLKAEYPGVDVYFGTSNKVEENKSPFSFKEKQLIATAQGIDPNKVLLANRPYVWDDYAKYFDADKTHIFFAVGEKDMEDDPRFTFNNIDTKSGLDMKLRPNKDTGEVEPKYYQMINTYKDDPRPMSQRGYIVQAPNVMSSGEDVASASAFRKALIDSPDKESAREIFNKQYKEYNESVFDLIYKKIVGDKMNEDLNTLMKLAGLGVQEDAPVEFDTPLKPEEIKFSPVSKSSSVMSIANRFPSGQDVNDPEVKKEEFLKALMKSPSSILSEINERILPDENGLEVSKKLSEIIDSMRDKGFMDIDKDDRGFVLDVVKNALKNMELKAGDERDFDPESGALESVELNDIRSDYGIAEKYEYENTEEKLQDMIGYHQGSIDNNHPDEINVEDEEDAIQWYEGLLQQHKETGADTFEAPFGGDTAWREKIQQEMEEIGLYKPAEAFRGADNLPEDEVDELNDLRKRAGLEVKEVIEDDSEYENDLAMEFVKLPLASMSKEEIRSEMSDIFNTLYQMGMGDEPQTDAGNAMEDLGTSVEDSGEYVNDDWTYPSTSDGEISDNDVQTIIKHQQTVKDVIGHASLDQDPKAPELFNSEEAVEEGKMKDIIMDLKDMSKEEFCSAHPQHADEYEDLCKQYDDDAQSEPQESFDAGAEQSREEEAYNELMDAYQKDGEEGLCKAIGCSHEELDREMTEWAMDHNLHMDDDRDEVIHGYIEDLVDNADWKDHGEYESVEDESMSKMRKLAGLPEEDKKHSIWVDGDKGTTKDGHNYRAVGDDQDASQYLKVFYGNGKYFRIYYDSNVGRYSPDQVAPETNDPKAEKIFADLPDDFFKKYGAEGENGIEDIIDMIKSVDESIEEAMCGCCGNDPCDCPKDCDGCRKDEAVEDTTVKALDDAMAELRTLAGI